MDVIVQRLKSKTYWLAFGLSLLTVAQANLPLLKDFLQENYNLYMFGIIMAIAVLREVTKVPLDEK